jgi:DNA-binding LytR/AlgR family response regulator
LVDGRKEEFYGTLKEVYEEQLQDFDFLFIHASYVVNYEYIAMVKYSEVILTSGKAPLPISKPKRAEIREVYCAMLERRRV